MYYGEYIAGKMCKCGTAISGSGTIAIPPQSSPPPLTPKDSLSVEIRELREMIKDGSHWMSQRSSHTIHRLFVIAEDLQAQLRRKDEALDKFRDVNGMSDCSDEHLRNMATSSANVRGPAKAEQFYRQSYRQSIARAALADGKEGGE